jgi:hypothetical protein
MVMRATARTRRWVPSEVEAAGCASHQFYGPIEVSCWHQSRRGTHWGSCKGRGLWGGFNSLNDQ